MPGKADIETLKERSHLTPGQCNRLFGHGPLFWSQAFDAGELEGYRWGARNARYITQESAKAYLGRVGVQQRRASGGKEGMRQLMREWHRSRQAAATRANG
jgi:hypothetical protein